MDSQLLPTENSAPLHCSNENFPQDSYPSLIHNDEPCSKEDRLHQLKEPVFAQPIQILSLGNPKAEESEVLLREVNEIDKILGQGWYFAYELWLFFVIIAVSLKGVFLCILVYKINSWNQDFAQLFTTLLMFALLYVFWSIHQASLHIKALWKKDPKIAAKAYNSLVKLSIYYFVLYIAFILVSMYWRYSSSGLGAYLWKYVNELLVIFIPLYVIPVGISVFGSYEIKVLLEEKMELLLKAGKGDMNGSEQIEPQKPQKVLL